MIRFDLTNVLAIFYSSIQNAGVSGVQIRRVGVLDALNELNESLCKINICKKKSFCLDK